MMSRIEMIPLASPSEARRPRLLLAAGVWSRDTAEGLARPASPHICGDITSPCWR
jgi:hypothetical protein